MQVIHLLQRSTVTLLGQVCQHWVCLKADRALEYALTLQLQLADLVLVAGTKERQALLPRNALLELAIKSVYQQIHCFYGHLCQCQWLTCKNRTLCM